MEIFSQKKKKGYSINYIFTYLLLVYIYILTAKYIFTYLLLSIDKSKLNG